MKTCSHCKQNLENEDFYKKGEKLFSYCKKCELSRKKQQTVNFKKQCLEYKNVYSCELCGYDKCIGSLDFHHESPDTKEFSISSNRRIIINDEIKKELDKCIVLCANCHRELHFIKEWHFSPNILKPKKIYYCTMCQSECSKNATKCIKCCDILKKELSKKPTLEQLKEDVKNLKSNVKIGKKYGVSDNTIKKWKNSYKI